MNQNQTQNDISVTSGSLLPDKTPNKHISQNVECVFFIFSALQVSPGSWSSGITAQSSDATGEMFSLELKYSTKILKSSKHLKPEQADLPLLIMSNVKYKMYVSDR